MIFSQEYAILIKVWVCSSVDRASGSGPEGRGFESLHTRYRESVIKMGGLQPRKVCSVMPKRLAKSLIIVKFNAWLPVSTSDTKP